MATAAQFETSKIVSPLVFNHHEAPHPPTSQGSEFELREQLSRTLDMETLLRTFFQFSEVEYSGYNYGNEVFDLDLRGGTPAENRVEYRLVLEDEQLGYLGIERTTPFTMDELNGLEERLSALIYPIRNALLYQAALKSAFRDPLTGVENRASLDHRLRREIQLAHRHQTPSCLLVLDVDRFKSINDSHGHHTGDRVLQQIVAVFQSVLRTTDVICRYGGDEFVIVLSNTDTDGALFVAERIRERVDNLRIHVGNVRLVLSVSIGLTQVQPRDDAHIVFERADRALLSAKEKGRNNVIVA